MKKLIVSGLLATFSAYAQQPCYQQMSDAVYANYAKQEKITVGRAKSNADVFINKFNLVGSEYSYEVEIAEQYASGSESGYYPGTKYKVFMTRSCQVISVTRF